MPDEIKVEPLLQALGELSRRLPLEDRDTVFHAIVTIRVLTEKLIQWEKESDHS